MSFLAFNPQSLTKWLIKKLLCHNKSTKIHNCARLKLLKESL